MHVAINVSCIYLCTDFRADTELNGSLSVGFELCSTLWEVPIHSLNVSLENCTYLFCFVVFKTNHLHKINGYKITQAKPKPSGKQFGDFCPAVAKAFVCLIDDAVLLLCPGGLLHLWVKVVVPALTALLANAALQMLGNDRPPLGPIFVDQLNHL